MIQYLRREPLDIEAILSRREREIATLVATGASNKEIGLQLAISTKTVKNTLTKVFEKTGARSRTELAIQLLRAEYGSTIGIETGYNR